MNPPNKIYIRSLGDVKFDLSASWHDVPYFGNRNVKDIEYIRKDALLEWAKEMKKANETYVDKDEPESTQ